MWRSDVPSTGQTDVSLPPAADESAAVENDYRTVSSLAVVSLIVGIAAPLCLFAPLLSVIPLFGAALAIVALRRVDLSGGVMIGRRAALLGLALCVGSLCAASSHSFAFRYLRIKQAAAVGSEWIGLVVAGQTQQAFDLTTASLRVPSPHEEGSPAESDPAAKFAATAPVPSLVHIGPGASVRLERNLSYVLGKQGECLVEQRYSVTPADDRADRTPMAVRLTLHLDRLPGQAQPRWLVVSCDRDAPSADGAAG
jgi:hypothetical protein